MAKLASFELAGQVFSGELTSDGHVIPWTPFPGLGIADGLGLAPACREAIDVCMVDRWLPPVALRRAVFCVGVNYRDHAAEAVSAAGHASRPSIFLRQPSSFVGHHQAIEHPSMSDMFDFEGELAVVIGRGGRHIAASGAMSHVAGYTCLAENSVRDFQRHGGQVGPGKNFDRSGAIGPVLVTADDIADVADLELVTRLNGATVQSGVLADLIHPIADVIAYISSFCALKPGDVIATGTPGGVGASRTPPLWLHEGDLLEVEISSIGTLTNHVAAESHAAHRTN